MSERTYTVVGVGAVGGYYGARLVEAGFQVHWVARSEADHLRRNGLRIRSPRGDLHLEDLDVYGPGEVPPPSDVVVVATKATATASVAPLLAPMVAPGGAVALFQNGMGGEDVLAESLRGVTILGAMSFICASRTGPGEVFHADYERVTVGEWTPDGTPSGMTPAVTALVEDLSAASIPAAALDDLLAGRWQKLVWNVPFNGLAVLLGARTDELVSDTSARRLVVRLMEEVVAAAEATGHPTPPDVVDKMLANTEAMVPYAPSMVLDHEAGRPLELEAIYEVPLAAAAAAGASMPATEVLLDSLRFIDRRNRAGDDR